MTTEPGSGLPIFLARCTKKIEEFADTEGVYRINGDNAAVQKLRSVISFLVIFKTLFFSLISLPHFLCALYTSKHFHGVY